MFEESTGRCGSVRRHMAEGMYKGLWRGIESLRVGSQRRERQSEGEVRSRLKKGD